MSQLFDKTISYTHDLGFEFDQAYTLSPAKTGTATVATPYLTLTNTAPTYESTAGPVGGSGSWRFNFTSGQAAGRVNTSSTNVPFSIWQDGDYSTGIWVRFNTLPAGTTQYSFHNMLPASSAPGFTLFINGSSHATAPSKIASNLFGGANPVITGSPTVVAGQWYYIAHRKSTTANTASIYIDGVLKQSGNNTTTANASNTIGFGSSGTSGSTWSMNLSNFYIAPYANIDGTAIGEIYTAGTSTATNVSITETPIIVTALMTDPTIVIVDSDNVEVVTSITASALIPDPTVTASQVINISATPLTASALMEEHEIIAGAGVLDFAEPFLASAEILHPVFIGSGDENIFETPATASGLFVDPTLDIETNFYALVRSKNPSLFITDPASPLINSGFDNWGVSGTIGSQMSIVDSPGQFGAIGNRKSWRASSDGAVTTPTLRFDDAEALTQSLYFQQTGSNTNNFTIECWYYPLTYDGTALENLINIGDTKVFVSASQISLQMNSDEIPNDGILEMFTHTVNAAMTTNAWNHILITGQYGGGGLNLTSKIYLNGEIKGTRNYFHVNNTALSSGITINANAGDLYGYFNGIALYKRVLTNSEILSNYNFVATSSPNRLIPADPFESAATLVDPDFITVSNKNFPATPITASGLNVDPSVLAAVGDGYDAEPIEVSATFVNPFFYGNPDARITATALTASADTPQNVYRLDTAYYSYVQTNIAPIRYVTFDLPNSNKDWGSDNDYGSAAPFTYGGSITSAIDGLNNNALLSDGLNYTTSGLIMKESEHDDAWGTNLETWHTSFWIKKDLTDTNPNGLRIIANLNSFENNKHLIVYQYNNYLYVQMDDKVNTPLTFQSSVNVNVFDNVKHHIVITSKSDNKLHVYKNKILVIDANFGNTNILTTNSTSYWAPNTETNNKPRFAVGALITPYAETNLPVIPTASKLLIDEAHWAVTSINQTGVNNLYAAMPYRIDINWAADQFLSNNSFVVDPTIRAGVGINSAAFTASSQIVNPGLTVDFDRNVNATAITASAQSVQPFSVIGDTVTNRIVISDIFLASSQMGAAVQRTTVPAQPMNASARIPATKPVWYDPYRALIIQQSLTYPAGNYYGFKVGDID